MNRGLSFSYLLASLSVGLWGVEQFQQTHAATTLLLLIVLAGMVYNNLTLLAGYWVEQGSLLKSLNWLRYLFHSFCIPLLVIVSFDFLVRINITWANQPSIIYGSWLLSFALIMLGIVDCANLKLLPNSELGGIHYKAECASVPVSTILTSLITAGIGLYLWISIQWPWLLIGTLAMIASNAFPSAVLKDYASPSTEITFMLSLFATASQIL